MNKENVSSESTNASTGASNTNKKQKTNPLDPTGEYKRFATFLAEHYATAIRKDAAPPLPRASGSNGATPVGFLIKAVSFDVFLSGFPEEGGMRQTMRCECCRRSFNKMVRLATVSEVDGSALPLWPKTYHGTTIKEDDAVDSATTDNSHNNDSASSSESSAAARSERRFFQAAVEAVFNALQRDEDARTVVDFFVPRERIGSGQVEYVSKKDSSAAAAGEAVAERIIIGSTTHLYIDSSTFSPWPGRTLTAGQKAAQLREDKLQIKRILGKFDGGLIGTAIAELKTLDGSSKEVFLLEWLMKLRRSLDAAKAKLLAGGGSGVGGGGGGCDDGDDGGGAGENNKNKTATDNKTIINISTLRKQLENLLFLETAKAPEGASHINASCSGAFLTTFAEKGADAARTEYKKMKDVTTYMRPTATTTGNKEVCTKRLKDLGINIARRLAAMEDVPKRLVLWAPDNRATAAATAAATASASSASSESPINITWAKFSREVLSSIVAQLEVRAAPTSFCYAHLTTTAAGDDDNNNNNNNTAATTTPPSAPYLAWDNQNSRNQIALYTYATERTAERWSLKPGCWYPCSGVTNLPWMAAEPAWKGRRPGIFIAIAGARDVDIASVPWCVFPEFIMQDLKDVRSSIESMSGNNKMSASISNPAGGYWLEDGLGNLWNDVLVRVTTESGTRNVYKLTSYD